MARTIRRRLSLPSRLASASIGHWRASCRRAKTSRRRRKSYFRRGGHTIFFGTMWNGFKVIDSDAHHHEPQDLWARYVEPKFQDRVPRVIGMKRNFFRLRARPKVSRQCLNRAATIVRTTTSGWLTSMATLTTAGGRPEVRLKDMDRFGWDIQVILSTNGNRIMEAGLADAEVGLAMARAYHNWCYDYASADSARLKFTATLAAGDSAMEWLSKRAARWSSSAPSRCAIRCCPRVNGCMSLTTMPCGNLPDDLDFPISLHGESRHLRAAPFRELRAAEIFQRSRSYHRLSYG